MATSPHNLPDIHVDTVNALSSISGIIGQKAIAEDTMVPYVYDGTNWVDTPMRKLNVKSGTPSITMASGAGTGATGSINGNNLAGTLTITTGLAVGTDPSLFTITLADNVSFPNKAIVQLQALDTASLSIISNVFQSVANATSATIKAKGLAVSANATYTFSYIIIGY